MSSEIWKRIPGYGDHYEASNLGQIRSLDRIVEKICSGINVGLCKQNYKGKVLKQQIHKHGHKTVHVGVDGKKFSLSVHRLVLAAFVGECPDGMEACHNNGISSDNRPENLRWDSHFENNQDRKKHGMYAVGEGHAMARLTDDLVREIRLSGLNGPQVAAKYGIGTSTAHRVITRESWSHVV